MAEQAANIFLAKGGREHRLLAPFANRHGLIAGATGTGKTVTLQVLAEGFADMGVPVFLADVKGDLAGISQPGGDNPKLIERARLLGLTEYGANRYPAIFWDLFGEQGHPIRATISELGPLLLSRMLELNDVQEGVLNIAFKVADDQGLLLLDLKDLRAMLNFLAENADQIGAQYGNVSKTSLGAIQRQLLVLEQQGAEKFLGEPALDLDDMMICDAKGRGCVNVLAADKLMQSPRLYATFLLWLLSELFERLPEIGDQPKPKFVFFFDEAHLLFADAPRALLTKIEQVVRLIRSKGVGVFFITQNPLDIPDTVLGQLGNRCQHALRAFTPRDQKAVRAAAETFRVNPKIDTERTITELGVGEALVSLLEGKGEPGIVDRALVLPPTSRLGPVKPEERKAIVEKSPLYGKYEDTVDRESAYERLSGRAASPGANPAPAGRPAPGDVDWGGMRRGPAPMPTPTSGPSPGPWGGSRDDGQTYRPGPPQAPPQPRAEPRPVGRPRDSLIDAMAKSAVRTIGSTVGREIIRGVLGGILGGRRR